METATLDRTKMIGGSDIAAIMGLSPWKTPLAVWAEKTGRIQNDLSNFEAAEIGTELEEYVARKFERKTGIKLRRDSRDFRHPVYEYMQGHIDRLVLDGESIFEAKTTSAWMEKNWQGEEIPQQYVLQVMWYLGLTKRQRGYIAVLIGGQKFCWKEVLFDQELFNKMVEAAKHFWEEFVLKDVMPMASADDNELLGDLYPQEIASKSLQIEGEVAEHVNAWLEEREGAIAAKKEAEKAAKEVEAKIKQLIGDAEYCETDLYKVSWKLIHKKEFTVAASSFRTMRAAKKGA